MELSLAFPRSEDPPVDAEQYQRKKGELLGRIIKLSEDYSQESFELRIGRLSRTVIFLCLDTHVLTNISVRSLRPLIRIVENLRQPLFLFTRQYTVNGTTHGTIHIPRFSISSAPTPPSGSLPFRSPIMEALREPAQVLGSNLLKAIGCTGDTVALSFRLPDPARLPSWSTSESTLNVQRLPRRDDWTKSKVIEIESMEATLVASRNAAEEQLDHVFGELQMQHNSKRIKPAIQEEVFADCLKMVSLLQVRTLVFCSLKYGLISHTDGTRSLYCT
jgi:hypothetical protein